MACQQLHNEHDAEDVVQDVFLKAWLHADALQSTEACDAWLGRICLNTCLDYQRARLRRREVLLSQEDTAFRTGSNPLEEGVLIRLETERLFTHLSSPLQQTMWDHYFHGLSIREIAQRLNKPEVTVRGMLFRARQALRQAAGKLPEE